MGMGLHIITQPDMVDDPPESVLSCDNQGLVPGDNDDAGDGDAEGDSGGASGAVTRLFGLAFPLSVLVLVTVEFW